MAKEGNSVNISGNNNTTGGIAQGDNSKVISTINVHQSDAGLTSKQSNLFSELQSQVDALKDDVEKQMAQAAVKGLEDELAKGESADESTLEKRIDGIRKTLGDVAEVVVATVASPTAGFSLIAQKVAKKITEQEQE